MRGGITWRTRAGGDDRHSPRIWRKPSAGEMGHVSRQEASASSSDERSNMWSITYVVTRIEGCCGRTMPDDLQEAAGQDHVRNPRGRGGEAENIADSRYAVKATIAGLAASPRTASRSIPRESSPWRLSAPNQRNGGKTSSIRHSESRASVQDFAGSYRRPGGSLPPPWTPASLSLLPRKYAIRVLRRSSTIGPRIRTQSSKNSRGGLDGAVHRRGRAAPRLEAGDAWPLVWGFGEGSFFSLSPTGLPRDVDTGSLSRR